MRAYVHALTSLSLSLPIYLLSTQSVITAAPLICLAASVVCVYVSRNGLVQKIGERTEMDYCGSGVAQRPADYHTQHRHLKLKMTANAWRR